MVCLFVLRKPRYHFLMIQKNVGQFMNLIYLSLMLEYQEGLGLSLYLTKGIVTMPGLPEVPNAEKMFIDNLGNITGKL